MDENNEKNPSPEELIEQHEYEMNKKISQHRAWYTMLEFIMRYKDTGFFRWINNHPRMSTIIVVGMGVAICAVFFAFLMRIMGLV